MNTPNQKYFAAAVLASALATAGCSAEMYAQANGAISTVRTANNAVGSARVPTAAIASAIGGMELVKALSQDGSEAKSQGLITAGGGNIIAAGGGNIIAAGGGNYDLLAFEVGKDIKKVLKDEARGTDCTLEYSSTANKSTNLIETVIKKFDGKVQGYDLASSGTFKYGFNTNGANGNVLCDITGTLKKGDFVLTIKKFHFETEDPLPKNRKIGDFVVEGKDGDETVSLVATLKTTMAGKVSATAQVSVNGVKRDKLVSFGEDNTSMTEVENADGDAGVQ